MAAFTRRWWSGWTEPYAIPGPPIEARPGDTLRIRLKNTPPLYDSSAWTGDHNVPHGLDATNPHVHGLDVVPHIFEPVGTSDPLAPQIEVGPGETKEYVFELPAHHPRRRTRALRPPLRCDDEPSN